MQRSSLFYFGTVADRGRPAVVQISGFCLAVGEQHDLLTDATWLTQTAGARTLLPPAEYSLHFAAAAA